MSVKTFEEGFLELSGFNPAEFIPEIIKKYALGQDIFYQCYWLPATETVQTPKGPVQYTRGALQVAMAMRGVLLGPEHFCWYFVTTTLGVDTKTLEEKIMEGLEHLRSQRASQNGLPFQRPIGSHQSLRDGPRESGQ